MKANYKKDFSKNRDKRDIKLLVQRVNGEGKKKGIKIRRR